MQLELFQTTTQGDRNANQDAMAHIIAQNYALFIVADGLGGHHAGEKASQYFCQGILKFANNFVKKIANNPAVVFANWIDAAIDEMWALFGDDQLAGMAYTTCAMLYLDETMAITAHCGDSRVYRINPSQILWRTRDHSVIQDLFDVGMITEEEMAQHPDQNQLTRSISVHNRHPIDVKTYLPISDDEIFVLCSDGFWEYIKKEELLQLADLESDEATLTRFVNLTMYRALGNSDNITVQVVRRKREQ